MTTFACLIPLPISWSMMAFLRVQPHSDWERRFIDKSWDEGNVDYESKTFQWTFFWETLVAEGFRLRLAWKFTRTSSNFNMRWLLTAMRIHYQTHDASSASQIVVFVSLFQHHTKWSDHLNGVALLLMLATWSETRWIDFVSRSEKMFQNCWEQWTSIHSLSNGYSRVFHSHHWTRSWFHCCNYQCSVCCLVLFYCFDNILRYSSSSIHSDSSLHPQPTLFKAQNLRSTRDTQWSDLSSLPSRRSLTVQSNKTCNDQRNRRGHHKSISSTKEMGQNLVYNQEKASQHAPPAYSRQSREHCQCSMSRFWQDKNWCIVRWDLGDSRKAAMDNQAWRKSSSTIITTYQFIDVLQEEFRNLWTIRSRGILFQLELSFSQLDISGH